jgi:hypothetical protein
MHPVLKLFLEASMHLLMTLNSALPYKKRGYKGDFEMAAPSRMVIPMVYVKVRFIFHN